MWRRFGAGCDQPHSPQHRPSSGRAGVRTARGEGPGPRLSRKQARVSAHPHASRGFRRCGDGGLGRGGVLPGAGRRRRRGSHETHHKWAPGESRVAAAAGEGGPRPRGRRPRAATRGRLGAAWRAGERRAPCTSCSAHAAFHRPALAEPASRPRRPSLPAPCPRDAARRRDAAGAPSGWRGPASRAAAGTRAQPSGSPIAWAFAFAPPPPASPLSPGGGTGRAPDSGLVHSAAEDYIYIQTVSLSPDSPLGRRQGGLFPRLLSFCAPALRITSGNSWEELRGWKMLLRFAKENFVTRRGTSATRKPERHQSLYGLWL